MAKTIKDSIKENQGKIAVSGEALKIWEEICNKPLELYGLPGQTVKNNTDPLPISETELCLSAKSPAVLPALETAIGNKFVVEQNLRFITVKRAAQSLEETVMPFVTLTPRINK
jgi:hypothetical protein